MPCLPASLRKIAFWLRIILEKVTWFLLVDARRVQADRARCPCQPRKSNPLQSCAQSAGARIKANKKEQFTACGEESTYPRDLFWSILPVRCRNPSHLPTGEIQGFASVHSPESTVYGPASATRWLGRAQRQWHSIVLERVQADRIVGCSDWWLESGHHLRLQPRERSIDGSCNDTRCLLPRAVFGPQFHDKSTFFSSLLLVASCFKYLFPALLAQGLNKEHLQWLQAVADRAACGLMALEGSTLFSEENSIVKKHFPDVIAGLARGRDDEEDEQMEPASENEGCS